ncbi:hypothetical protein HERIO_562 [Hepatospora eriocheir]|uniref:Uncharacterized protein n=1 Tax=Hepatospora eriocheir TaxID=1081669 RepID=A0A1X0QCM3_9MICR|nr:hypothetical protein HERIO_562 [Hepatospora eriocheir]
MYFKVDLRGEFRNIKAVVPAKICFIDVRCGKCKTKKDNISIKHDYTYDLEIQKGDRNHTTTQEVNYTYKCSNEDCGNRISINMEKLSDLEFYRRGESDVYERVSKVVNDECTIARFKSDSATIETVRLPEITFFTDENEMLSTSDLKGGVVTLTSKIGNPTGIIENFKITVKEVNKK